MKTTKDFTEFIMKNPTTGVEMKYLYKIPLKLSRAIQEFDEAGDRCREAIQVPIKFTLREGYMKPLRKSYPPNKEVKYKTTGTRTPKEERKEPKYDNVRRYSGNRYINE